MPLKNARFTVALSLDLMMILVVTGCGSNGTLPSTVILELPDGTTVEVDAGTGVPSLADSSWAFLRISDTGQEILFVTVVFGAEGNLVAFEDNTFSQDILGDTIVFDGSRQPTSLDGVEYAATTFGAATVDGTGFAFEGQFSVFYLGLNVGGGEAGAVGTFDADDPDTITGTFSFSMELTIPIEIPGANQSDSFSFVAHRVVAAP